MTVKYNRVTTDEFGFTAQTVDEVMTGFNRGDRVSMIEPHSKYTGKYGTVVGYRENAFKSTLDLEIQFDCNQEGHYVYFPPSYFSKLPLETKNKKVQQERTDYAKMYAEWFAVAYQSIESAGGVPTEFISRLPSDVIDSMVRNNLHIIYVGPIK